MFLCERKLLFWAYASLSQGTHRVPGCCTRCTHRLQRGFLITVHKQCVMWTSVQTWMTNSKLINQTLKSSGDNSSERESHLYSDIYQLGFSTLFFWETFPPAMTRWVFKNAAMGHLWPFFPLILHLRWTEKAKEEEGYILLSYKRIIETVNWSLYYTCPLLLLLLPCNWQGNHIKINQHDSSNDWIWKPETLQFNSQMRAA